MDQQYGQSAGLRLDATEEVIGTMVIESGQDDGHFLMCVGQKGIGKRTSTLEFTAQWRGGGGVYAFRANKKTGPLVAAVGVRENQDLVMFSQAGITNRIHVGDVRDAGRVTSGVILMNLDEGDVLKSVITTAHQDGQDGQDGPDGQGGPDGSDQASAVAKDLADATIPSGPAAADGADDGGEI